MSLIVDEHREYLADEPRIRAFGRAIDAVTRPGDVVLDLGAGTGILGLMACRAGAARVYAIEHGPVIALAREIARANGVADRVTFIKELSTRVSLPERVDLVVCDQIGRFGFEAGLLEYLGDARERMLKPGGRMLPSRVELIVAPVISPGEWARVRFWDDRRAGFDFSPAARRARHTGYPASFESQSLLGPPAVLGAFDLARSADAIRGSAAIPIQRADALHGIGGWFTATLAPGVSMTNSPIDPDRIARRQAFFPIERPVDVEIGDLVRIVFDIRPIEMVVNWRVAVDRQGPAGTQTIATFRQSTFEGMLLPKEDVERTRPEARPRLSPAGEARRSILELCEGRRTIAEIEAEVLRRHSNLLRSREQAAVFVAEVLTSYAI